MAKTYTATADRSTRSRAVITIAAFIALALFSVIMSVYDLASGMTLYGVLFGIAAIIFIVLMLLKINSVFGTYIKLKQGVLYMKSWSTDFIPYDNGRGFFSDLKPAKTKLSKIPEIDIDCILIGTKEFVRRNMSEAGKKFNKAVYPYEHAPSRTRRNLIDSIDIFYLETMDGDCCFMSVEGYDEKKIVDIIAELYKHNRELYVKVGSRKYKKYLKQIV